MKTNKEKVVEIMKKTWLYKCGEPKRVYIGHPVDWYEQLTIQIIESFFEDAAYEIDQLYSSGEEVSDEEGRIATDLLDAPPESRNVNENEQTEEVCPNCGNPSVKQYYPCCCHLCWLDALSANC